MKKLTEDEKFMKAAIAQAGKAEAINEVPIGCVIVREGRIIARGYNRRNTDKSVLAHAEIAALRKACRITGDWRLEDCTIYVTLEPCQMCAGALVQSRIKKAVIGAKNPKAGSCGSVIDITGNKSFNHQVETKFGVMEHECSEMLTNFFKKLRDSKK